MALQRVPFNVLKTIKEHRFQGICYGRLRESIARSSAKEEHSDTPHLAGMYGLSRCL